MTWAHGVIAVALLALVGAVLAQWWGGLDGPTVAELVPLLWLLTPFVLMAVLVRVARTAAARTAILTLASVVAVLGTAYILSIMLFPQDALAGLVVLAVPIGQGLVLLLIGLPLLLALNRVPPAGNG